MRDANEVILAITLSEWTAERELTIRGFDSNFLDPIFPLTVTLSSNSVRFDGGREFGTPNNNGIVFATYCVRFTAMDSVVAPEPNITALLTRGLLRAGLGVRRRPHQSH